MSTEFVIDWKSRTLIVRDVSRPAGDLRWRISDEAATVIEGINMALILSAVQQVFLSITPVDRKGHLAPVDGVPEWSLSNPIGTLIVADDGMSAQFVAEAPGTTQINVVADARLGDDIAWIAGTLDVTIQPAEAVSLQIVAGAPEDQPG